MRSKIIKCFFLLICASSADAAFLDYSINIKKRISIPIAEKGINRIAIEKDRISRIIGNESEYILDSDISRGQVFITSKLPAQNSFGVTIVSEKGIIQDVLFKIEKINEPVSVTLKHQDKTGKKAKIQPTLIIGKSQNERGKRGNAKNMIKDYNDKNKIKNSVNDIFAGNTQEYHALKLFDISLSKQKVLVSSPVPWLKAQVIKTTLYTKGSLMLTHIECRSLPSIERKVLKEHYANLVAFATKGNSLVIVERI